MSDEQETERLKNNDQVPEFPEAQKAPAPGTPGAADADEIDQVDEAAWESFPASDPPSYNRSTGSPTEQNGE